MKVGRCAGVRVELEAQPNVHCPRPYEPTRMHAHVHTPDRQTTTTVRGPRARALDAGQREEQAHVPPDGAALRPAQPHAAGCVHVCVNSTSVGPVCTPLKHPPPPPHQPGAPKGAPVTQPDFALEPGHPYEWAFSFQLPPGPLPGAFRMNDLNNIAFRLCLYLGACPPLVHPCHPRTHTYARVSTRVNHHTHIHTQTSPSGPTPSSTTT